ncbi:hypothetical protein M513_14037 [Trichuris suis]|uniref:Uncharacterized protein n=1 Tax=Trichuris suis TaxID=68888 RepID=A0A085LJE2_9BILA|nr:hypothetical protein M513_14037 [Trichuris suis]
MEMSDFITEFLAVLDVGRSLAHVRSEYGRELLDSVNGANLVGSIWAEDLRRGTGEERSAYLLSMSLL